MEKKVERIQVDKKNKTHNVRVNQDFVDELVEQSKKGKSTKKATDVEKLMTDDRFKSMFEDIEFKVSIAATHCYRHMIAHHLSCHHGDCLTLGGVDLAWHDGGPGLILWQRQPV